MVVRFSAAVTCIGMVIVVIPIEGSDNEADISDESANNSLERPNSKSPSISNLHGLQEVSNAVYDNVTHTCDM